MYRTYRCIAWNHEYIHDGINMNDMMNSVLVYCYYEYKLSHILQRNLNDHAIIYTLSYMYTSKIVQNDQEQNHQYQLGLIYRPGTCLKADSSYCFRFNKQAIPVCFGADELVMDSLEQSKPLSVVTNEMSKETLWDYIVVFCEAFILFLVFFITLNPWNKFFII